MQDRVKLENTYPNPLQALQGALPCNESAVIGRDTKVRARQGIVCGATSEQTREERSVVLVDLITDGLQKLNWQIGKVGK